MCANMNSKKGRVREPFDNNCSLRQSVGENGKIRKRRLSLG
jgi:hypothetical protein